VGNHQQSLPLCFGLDIRQHTAFRVRVQTFERLIEHNQVTVSQHGPDNRNPALLATTQGPDRLLDTARKADFHQVLDDGLST